MQTLQRVDMKFKEGDRVYCNIKDNDRSMELQPFIVTSINADGTYKLQGVYRRHFDAAEEQHIIHALATPEALVKLWQRQDPHLLDADGMQSFIDRRLQAQDLRWLMRTGHPSNIGLDDISRFDVMHRISEKRLQFLEDLGWPTDLNSYYKNIYTGSIHTLEQELWGMHDDLDSWRTEMHKTEEQLNELTNGDFYCLLDLTKGPGQVDPNKNTLGGKGLECTSVKEMRWYLKYYPHIEQIVKESLRLHKAFYERLNAGRHGEPRLITDRFFRSDECMAKIAGMCRMFEIDLDKLEDTSTFPERSIEGHVWSIVEHYEPATREEVEAWFKEHPTGEEEELGEGEEDAETD